MARRFAASARPAAHSHGAAEQCDELAAFHVWMAPAWQEKNVPCRTEVACSHVSGLFTQSGGTAGPDG